MGQYILVVDSAPGACGALSRSLSRNVSPNALEILRAIVGKPVRDAELFGKIEEAFARETIEQA